MDYEELTSVDECLTQRFIGTGIYSGNAVYYAVDPNLLNSRLFVGLVFTESDNENKLAFAFDMGEYYVKNTSTGIKQYYGFKTGSIFPFYDYNTGELLEDKNGNIFRYALTFVGEHGCFNRFFKEYDSFLRHSNNIVKFELSQPLIDISHLDFFSKYMVDNQPLLFDKVKHIIGMDKSITAEARTLRLYEPYNTGEDHNIPAPNPILYKWVLNSNRSDVIAAKRLERETYWRSHPMVYEFISYVLREIVSDSYAYDNLDFWYLPPTQDQYDRQDKIKLPDGALELIYRLTYKTTGASHPTTYYDENFNLSYNIWFEPQPV